MSKRRPDPLTLATRNARKPAAPPRLSDQGDPDFTRRGPLPLAELPPSGRQERIFFREGNATLKVYRLGECSVIVTRPHGRWHASISHPSRYPTWDEIAEARYRLLPGGAVMAMVLPPRTSYVNIDRNCFQLLEIVDPHHGDFSGA